LVVTYTMVGTHIVIGCWTSCLSMLAIGWTTIGNYPTEYGVYVGGTSCPSTGYTFLDT
jgi:hypothetical protein